MCGFDLLAFWGAAAAPKWWCCCCYSDSLPKRAYLSLPKCLLLLVCFFIIYILGGLDILFSSNHNIHKSSCGLFIWNSDPLIDRLLLKNKGHTKFYEYFLLTKKSISNWGCTRKVLNSCGISSSKASKEYS